MRKVTKLIETIAGALSIYRYAHQNILKSYMCYLTTYTFLLIPHSQSDKHSQGLDTHTTVLSKAKSKHLNITLINSVPENMPTKH